MKKGERMNVIENLTNIVKLLDELDIESSKIPQEESNIDTKLSDVYHFIENNHLTTNQRYRIVSLITQLRKERRNIKNKSILLRTLEQHQNKLIQLDNRKMLLAEMHKREKQLQSTYKYRIYTEEELKELVGE